MEDFLRNTFINTSYWIMLGLVLWWFYTLAQYLQLNIKFFLTQKKVWIESIAVAMLAVAIILITHPILLKTNSDEANLLAVAQSFYSLHQPFNITEAKYYFDNLNPLTLEIPTRPLVFPFFVNLIHLFTGGNPISAFILNALAGGFILFAAYYLWLSRQRRLLGIATVLFLLSQGVFTSFMTSAGFDVFSVAFFILTAWVAVHLLRNPQNINFLISTAAVFASIRYENPLLMAILLGVFWFQMPATQRKIRLWVPGVLLTGISLFPSLLQRYLTHGHYENPPGVPVFGVSNFLEHTAGMTLTILDPQVLYHNGLNIIALFALAGLVLLKRNSWLVVLPLAVQLVLSLSHHAGVYAHPTQVRFFLPLSIFAAWVLPYLYQQYAEKIVKESWLVLAALASFIFYFPISSEARFLNKLVLNRDIQYLYPYFEKLNTKRLLIIYERPVQFTAIGMPSISTERAKNEIDAIHAELKQGLYDRVFSVETLTYGKEPESWTAKTGQFKLIEQIQQAGDQSVVIFEMMK